MHSSTILYDQFEYFEVSKRILTINFSILTIVNATANNFTELTYFDLVVKLKITPLLQHYKHLSFQVELLAIKFRNYFTITSILQFIFGV